MGTLLHRLGLPLSASAHGPEIDRVLIWIHGLMAILLIGWGLFFITALFRFRRSKNPKADYRGIQSHFSTYLEAGVAAFEIILLVGLSIPVWSKVTANGPVEGNAVVVRVVAEQYAWNVRYPGPDGNFGRTDLKFLDAQSNPVGLDPADSLGRDDITTVNQLKVPVNTPIQVELTSKDVIHSFNLVEMRVKQDVIPGMVIPVRFEAVQTGHWEIACAQLCGLAHYRMRGFLEVLSKEDYEKWLSEEAAAKVQSPGGGEVW